MQEIYMHKYILFFPIALVFYGLFLTQYIQEDAFIYFRTALNLAESGDYSFNFGEEYPAATSALYTFIIALQMYLFPDFYTLSVQALNVAVSVAGACFLVGSVPGALKSEHERSFLLFFIIFSPPLMRLAVSGMETPFVFLFLSVMIYGYTKSWILIFLASVFLPLFRIEASIAPLILCFVSVFAYKWRNFYCGFFGIILGILAFFAINYYFSGSVFPQTISAKESAYEPSRDFLSIMYRVYQTFFESSYFLGFQTKFIPDFAYILIGILVAFIFSWILISWVYKVLINRSSNTEELSWLAILIIVSLAFPIGYSIGGVLFPWYTWPSSVFSYFILGFTALKLLHDDRRQRIMALLLVLLLPTSIISFALMTNYGYQEAGFRSSVGKYINKKSAPTDTLFLEPAGYIPFYAELKTWDTVGLVSPDVLDYRSKENLDWWIQFVMEKTPTFIVERSPIHVSGYPDGTSYLGLTEEDRTWFSTNYELLKEFSYTDYVYDSRGVLTPIYKLGGHSDYFLYKKIDRINDPT